MSVIYRGEVIETELSKNSNGGTEMMRQRLIDNANPDYLKDVAIHLSRTREMYEDVPNILWCHDLAEDPENRILADGGWQKFDRIIFVSAWQRDQFILRYGIPYSHCAVICNAVEKEYKPREKEQDKIRFIYHTTPHRGLELLVPIFEALCTKFDNLHLDVYSSFSIYGWESRDEPYKDTFAAIEAHPNMTYHGAVPNEEVLEALDKAHVFLYPNVWRETSCIALIEAIKSQVICIHPNYGALPETSANATITYDFKDNLNDHANYAYSVAKQLVQVMNNDPNYFNGFTYSDRFNLARNSIQSFKTMWDATLANVLNR